MKPVRYWVLTHTGVLLLGVFLVVLWFAYHKPPPQVVEHTVFKQAPGAPPTTFNVTLPGGGPSVPQIVFTPPTAPTVRVITVPAPAVVSPAEKQKIQEAAPLAVSIRLNKVCIHPDTAGLPDPTCGVPVAPDLLAVQKADHTGFVIVQDPNEALSTQVGSVETRETGIGGGAQASKWTYRIGAGAMSGGASGAAFQAQYNFSPSLFAQATIVGGGIGGPGILVMAGLQF